MIEIKKDPDYLSALKELDAEFPCAVTCPPSVKPEDKTNRFLLKIAFYIIANISAAVFIFFLLFQIINNFSAFIYTFCSLFMFNVLFLNKFLERIENEG